MSDTSVRGKFVDLAIEDAKAALDANRDAMVAAPTLRGFTLQLMAGGLVTLTLHAMGDPPRACIGFDPVDDTPRRRWWQFWR